MALLRPDYRDSSTVSTWPKDTGSAIYLLKSPALETPKYEEIDPMAWGFKNPERKDRMGMYRQVPGLVSREVTRVEEVSWQTPGSPIQESAISAENLNQLPTVNFVASHRCLGAMFEQLPVSLSFRPQRPCSLQDPSVGQRARWDIVHGLQRISIQNRIM